MNWRFGKRVLTMSGNNNNNEIPTRQLPPNDNELVSILPSYQLEQSIFGQKLSVTDNDAYCIEPPLYTNCYSNTTTLSNEFNDVLLDTPTLQKESIIYNLTKLPYCHFSNLKMEIILNESSQKKVYTNGDILQGYLKLQNTTNTYISFESLIVSLDGRVSVLKEEGGYKRKNFLTLVDFTSCFTDADPLLNGEQDEQTQIKRSLPLNKRIPPLSIFERPFSFKIPEVVLEHQFSDSSSLVEDFSLPPSIGFLHFLNPIDPFRKQELKNYQVHKVKNDLTNDSYSISYSINARIITRNVVSNQFNISTHAELFCKFIPTTPRISYGLHPTQQLKYLLRSIERELIASTKKKSHITTTLSSSSTTATCMDDEKSQNIYQSTPLSSNLTDCSKISYESCPVYENHAILTTTTSRKLPSLKSSSSCHVNNSQTKGFVKISSPNLQESFQLAMDGNSSNEIKLNLTLTFEPPPHNQQVSTVDPTTILPIVAPLMTFSIGVNKIGPNSTPISFDLDGSWFLNKKSFELNLKDPINKIANLKQSLPRKTQISTRVFKDMNSLFALKPPMRHVFQDAFISTVTESKWESRCWEGITYTKDISITLQISPDFNEKYLLVPTFHTLQFARFYSINVGLKLSQKLSKCFAINYQDYESSLILNIPVDICYTE